MKKYTFFGRVEYLIYLNPANNRQTSRGNKSSEANYQHV